MSSLLSVTDLALRFLTEKGPVDAVQNATFDVARGCTTCLVGASGSGKTASCHAMMGLLPENAQVMAGRAMFDGQDLLGLTETELASIRGRKIAMIFQEPVRSLNPVHRIGVQISETLRLHRGLAGSEALAEAERLLTIVGIPDPRGRLRTYPHEHSGGMCQRVMIAMALASRPDLLIADEPTTALDVTIQAQILQLLKDLQREFGMAILLITHDMGVVAEMADEVAVMYDGRTIERGPAVNVFDTPRHAHTRDLVKSAPRLPEDPDIRPPALAEIGPAL